jgi:hypothetical protein
MDQHIRLYDFIMDVPELSLSEALLLSMIKDMDNVYGCYESNHYFAQRLKCNERTICNMISKLRRLGFIHDMDRDDIIRKFPDDIWLQGLRVIRFCEQAVRHAGQL